MKCENCGLVVKDDSKFCPYCGHQIEKVTIPNTKEKKLSSRDLGKFFMMAGAILVGIAILYPVFAFTILIISLGNWPGPSVDNAFSLLIFLLFFGGLFVLLIGIKLGKGGFSNKVINIIFIIISFSVMGILLCISVLSGALGGNFESITKEAVSKKDGKICQKIPHTRFWIQKEYPICNLEVAKITKDEDFCEETDAHNKQLCYADIAVFKHDMPLCKEKGCCNCENTIRAFQTQDVSLCGKGASNYYYKCISDILAVQKDEKFCEKVDSLESVFIDAKMYKATEFCYYSVAINTDKMFLCKKTGELRHECVKGITNKSSNIIYQE